MAANAGLTQSALARAIDIEQSTMVFIIKFLEDRKLVERRPSPVDGRSSALVLSSEGIKLFDQLKFMVLEHEKELPLH